MAGTQPRMVDLERRHARDGRAALEQLRDGRGAAPVAAAAGLPPAHVHGTQTFYTDLREAPARRTCIGTGCFAASGGEPDPGPGRAVHCLGCCYAGPAVLDGERLLCGPDRDRDAPPIPWRVAADEAIVLEDLTGDGPPPGTALDGIGGDGDRVLAAVHDAGLIGRGGAAFPAARKWQAAREAAADGPRYVVANGDEGDAGSYADRLLMESMPERVLEGLVLTALACRATHALVYVRSEYPAARDAMRAAVARWSASGRLGALTVDVVEGAGSYVAGEETALLHALAGLRGTAAVRPPYPADAGLLGRPTVVNNVETLASVPWIVRHGAQAYRRHGTGDAPGTKLVSLTERFARPGVVEVPFGISLRTVVEELGGGLRDGRRLTALQVGGPLGGFLGPADLDVALTPAALHAVGIELGHAGLVAIDDRVEPAELLVHLWRFGATESCGGCVPCRVGTQRGLEVAERIAREGPSRALTAEHNRLLDVVGRASLCGFGQGLAPAVRSLVRVFGRELACA